MKKYRETFLLQGTIQNTPIFKSSAMCAYALHVLRKNSQLNKDISIIAYSLMQDTYTLLIQPNSEYAIFRLMYPVERKILRYYTGLFKISDDLSFTMQKWRVKTHEQLLESIKYIHTLPHMMSFDHTVNDEVSQYNYPWSSRYDIEFRKNTGLIRQETIQKFSVLSEF